MAKQPRNQQKKGLKKPFQKTPQVETKPGYRLAPKSKPLIASPDQGVASAEAIFKEFPAPVKPAEIEAAQPIEAPQLENTAEVQKAKEVIPKLESPLAEPIQAPPQVNIIQQSAPAEEPDENAPGPEYQKGNWVAKALSQARQTFFGSRVASPLEAKLRKELIPFTQKAETTKSLITQNLDTLREQAKTNKTLAEILKHVEDTKYQKSLDEVVRKIRSDEEVFAQEMREVASYFDNVAGGLDQFGLSLQYSLPSIIQAVQEMTGNEQLNVKVRKDALNALLGILDEQKIQHDSVEALKGLNSDQLNFSKIQIDRINGLTNALLQDQDVKDKRVLGTYKDLTGKLGSILLNIKEWRAFTEKPADTDQTVRESLLSKGLGAVGTGAKQGLLDTAFAALGLPGFGTLLGGLGLDPLKGIGSLGKAFGKGGFGKLFGGFSGEALAAEGEAVAGSFTGLARVVTPLAEVFGELVLPIVALGSAIYGAAQGIMDTLDEWKKFFVGIFDFTKSIFGFLGRLYDEIDGMVDEFSQVHPVLGAILSGLTTVVKTILGIPKLIIEGFKNIFGWIGVGAGKLGDTLEAWSKGIDSTLPAEQPPTQAQQQVGGIQALAPEIFGGAANTSSENVLNTLTGNAPLSTPAPQNPITGQVQPQPVMLNPQATPLATTQNAEQQKFQKAVMETANRPIVVNTPPPPMPPTPPARKNGVEDIYISMTSHGVLYR